jgi:broad specificity phosphatase PhoE
MQWQGEIPVPTIILIRHAAPDFDIRKTIRGDALGRAIEDYDAAPLAASPGPFTEIQAHTVYSSDKRRSIETASALFPNAEILSSTLYRESALPTTLPRWVRLPFVQSLALARCAWIVGYSPGVENWSHTRSRAVHATRELIDHANDQEQAVLVGHGLFNRFIGSRLKTLGWIKQRDEGNGYCSWQLYTT